MKKYSTPKLAIFEKSMETSLASKFGGGIARGLVGGEPFANNIVEPKNLALEPCLA